MLITLLPCLGELVKWSIKIFITLSLRVRTSTEEGDHSRDTHFIRMGIDISTSNLHNIDSFMYVHLLYQCHFADM